MQKTAMMELPISVCQIENLKSGMIVVSYDKSFLYRLDSHTTGNCYLGLFGFKMGDGEYIHEIMPQFQDWVYIVNFSA